MQDCQQFPSGLIVIVGSDNFLPHQLYLIATPSSLMLEEQTTMYVRSPIKDDVNIPSYLGSNLLLDL